LSIRRCIAFSCIFHHFPINTVLLLQDPNTKTGAQIGRELGQDGGVQVVALLEKALHQRDMAMATKENKKGKAAKVRAS
jgi:hypothetical protein